MEKWHDVYFCSNKVDYKTWLYSSRSSILVHSSLTSKYDTRVDGDWQWQIRLLQHGIHHRPKMFYSPYLWIFSQFQVKRQECSSIVKKFGSVLTVFKGACLIPSHCNYALTLHGGHKLDDLASYLCICWSSSISKWFNNKTGADQNKNLFNKFYFIF